MFEKLDTNGDGVIDKEELVAAVNKNGGKVTGLFDPDADSDADTEIESGSESGEESGEESDDGEITESIVIDGQDYQIDANNNVYEEDEDGDWVKVGIWTERGELVKDD